MKYIKYLPIALMLCLCSCKSGNATSQATDIPQDSIKTFTLPAIPAMLNTPELRADFLVRHIGIMSTLQILTIFIIRTSPNKPGLIIATF